MGNMKLLFPLRSFITLALPLLHSTNVHSFTVDSSRMVESPRLINRQNSNCCGPTCKKYSIEQFNSSESSPLSLSGGASSSDLASTNNNMKAKAQLMREMIAEFFGTYIIVQLGCGTVCAAIFKSAQAGLWQIAQFGVLLLHLQFAQLPPSRMHI